MELILRRQEEGKKEFQPWEGIFPLVAKYLEDIPPGLITLGKFHVHLLGKTYPKPILSQFPGDSVAFYYSLGNTITIPAIPSNSS